MVATHQKTRGRAITFAAAAALVLLTGIAFFVPIPYGSMRPGPAFDTLGEFEGAPMIEFGSEVQTYDTDGSLFFTTVSVTRQDFEMSLVHAISVYFQPNTELIPRDVLFPEAQTQEETEQIAAAQLDQSKVDAEVAGVRAAGFTVPEWPEVASVLPDSPATGIIETGDKIRSVNGVATNTPFDVITQITSVAVGDTVRVVVDRDGEEISAEIVTFAADAEPDRPRIGVQLISGYDMPVDVDNNVGHSIGGPSAGTMFALAIYDKLTPGALAGGKKIGGTGTINSFGQVGRIGGVKQKIAGAANQGASVFLVPADNCSEALDGEDFSMTLVKISTLDDAIRALEAISAGNTAAVPRCGD